MLKIFRRVKQLCNDMRTMLNWVDELEEKVEQLEERVKYLEDNNNNLVWYQMPVTTTAVPNPNPVFIPSVWINDPAAKPVEWTTSVATTTIGDQKYTVMNNRTSKIILDPDYVESTLTNRDGQFKNMYYDENKVEKILDGKHVRVKS